MQDETSEGLYGEAVAAPANSCREVPIAPVGASAQIPIAFCFYGLSTVLFGARFGWNLLFFFEYDCLFACVAAFAPVRRRLSGSDALLTFDDSLELRSPRSPWACASTFFGNVMANELRSYCPS